jgi:hypothetical protein
LILLRPADTDPDPTRQRQQACGNHSVNPRHRFSSSFEQAAVRDIGSRQDGFGRKSGTIADRDPCN